MTTYESILYDVQDRVATLTFNRPDSLNAFTNRMMAEIRHALGESEKNGDVIGTILTGAGRGFCAGLDMNALDDMSTGGSGGDGATEALACDPGNPDQDPNFELATTFMLGLRKPVIAAINGACAGLGFSYAIFCDMRFVDRGAKFVTAFSQRGLIAEHGVSWMLPRLIGPSRALDILWSSRRFDGEEAYRLGIADRLCEPGEALTEARAYLADLAQNAAPNSLMFMKRQVYKHLNAELGPAMAQTIEWMDASLKRDDFREGVRSFVERRPPNFDRIEVE